MELIDAQELSLIVGFDVGMTGAVLAMNLMEILAALCYMDIGPTDQP